MRSIAVAIAMWMLACRPAEDPAALASRDEQLACVKRARTVEESGECRRAVRAKYAPLMPDGGP